MTKEEFNQKYEDVCKQCDEICPGLHGVIKYLQQIPPPKTDEVKNTLKRVYRGEKSAKKRLIELYLHKALYLSLQSAKENGMPLEDLFSEAVVALMEYAEQLENHETNITYLSPTIKKSLNQYVLNYKYNVSVPKTFEPAIRKTETAFQNGLNLYAPDAIKEVCSETGMTERTVFLALSCILPPLPCEEINIIDSDDTEKLIYRRLCIPELHDLIMEAFESLRENRKIVLDMKYGIECKRCTIEQIAEVLCLSPQRIYEIKKTSLKNLRHSKTYAEKLRQYLDIS